jgi:hypothetical protein
LFALAAGAVGGAVAVAVHPHNDVAPTLVWLALAIITVAVAPVAVTELGVWAATLVALIVLSDNGGTSGRSATALFVGFGIVWILLAVVKLLSAREFGVVVGTLTAYLATLSWPFWDDAGVPVPPIIIGVIAIGCFALYLPTELWALTGSGVVGITISVPWIVEAQTNGALGASGGVLIAGVALLVASAVGFRLRRQVANDPAETQP